MTADRTNQQISQDGLQIFDLLTEIFLKSNPYDNLSEYIEECKKQFADIENDNNIESIKEDLFRRWTNGQLDSLNTQGIAPDKNKIISFLQKGEFVITDYQYLFYKMMYS
jgi:hypothetical protein